MTIEKLISKEIRCLAKIQRTSLEYFRHGRLTVEERNIYWEKYIDARNKISEIKTEWNKICKLQNPTIPKVGIDEDTIPFRFLDTLEE